MAVRIGNDYWGDYKSYALGKFEGSLHYYFIDESLLRTCASKNAMAIPPVSAVINATYTPYLYRDLLELIQVPLDIERFPPNENQYGGAMIPKTNLMRIQTATTDFFDRSIGNFMCYKPERVGGGNYHWSNEGKLWQYPYSYIQLADGISSTLEIIPHYCKNPTQKQDVMVAFNINNFGIYNLFVNQYKNGNRLTSGNVVENPKTMPITSSVYSDFMASNQSQMAVQQKRAKFDAGVGVFQGLTQVATGGAKAYISGGVLGADDIASGLGQVVGSVGDGYFNTKALLAQKRDMANVSNTLIDTGSDVVFNKRNGNGYLNLYRLRMTNDYMELLGSYFHMYGYAQNKLMYPNIRNRYYFNYMKTVQCNIKGYGMSKTEIEELKSIYNNGITIWHVDRDGVNVGDYSRDNYEI